MHEVSIMQEVLRVAEEKVRASGGTAIQKIRLRIGRLSGVVPEALEYAFEVLQGESLAAGGKLEIESIPTICWCEPCQKEFATQDYLFECPVCGQMSGKLIRGREMELASLEIS